MRKIVLYMMITIDGFISGPDEGVEYFEPTVEEHLFANKAFASVDGVVFGRTIYQGFISYWDTLDLTLEVGREAEIEFAKIFRKLHRVVVSRTLTQIGEHTDLIKDNLADRIGLIKQQVGRDYLLVCGPELLATLMADKLVDELMLLVMPKVLGRGKALFGQMQVKPKLNLLSLKRFESGSVLHHYACVA